MSNFARATFHRSAPRFAALACAALFFAPVFSLASATAPPTPASLPPTPLVIIDAAQFSAARYLIVTGGPYASAMQSIADWKTAKGLPARVALIEDIKASYAGRDDAERLHNFLQDVYFNASAKQLKYVLLGGGVNVIPVRYLHTQGSVITFYTHDDVFSDVYYAGLDSSWDTNGNGIFGEYGEEDWDANVFVGRLPFNDTAGAAIARDNLLSYEKAPFVGSWMRNVLAVASVFDPPNNVVPPNNYDWFEDNGLRAYQLTQPYIPPTMSVNLLADYYELLPGNYTPGLDRLSDASEVGAINAGASVVMSVTHGWVPSGKGTPEYDGFDGVSYSWGQGLTWRNATNFTNFGQLSFGYFSSCLIGNFTNPDLPNFGRFVLQQNHGFVAEIVPTDGTLRGEDDFTTLGISEGNWWQSENFWKNFFEGAEPFRPGPALYAGIRDYAAHIREVNRDESWGGYRTQKAVYNLLGDPEVPIWTDVASTFSASLPSKLYTAEQHFRATFRDTLGRPAAGATVALQGAGVDAVATADAQGRVDVLVAPTSIGQVTVTSTLHNFLPYQAQIPVEAAPPDLSIEPSNVTLPSPVLLTGASATVGLTVRNVGQLSAGATDVRAYDTPPSGVAQLIGSPISLASLGAGGQAALSFGWAPAEDGLHSLRVVVDLPNVVAEFDELNNEVTLPVEVSSVDLSLSASSVSLDPPGQVAPGGQITATGTVGRVGLVPRGYLIGYELLRADGNAAASGNVVASATLASFQFVVPAAEAGAYTLHITVDSGREIVEFNESNNAVDFAVAAGAGPAIYGLPPVLLDEDAPPTPAVVDLRAFVADPDTPFSQLTFRATSSASELEVWVDGPVLIALPAPDWSGTGTIALNASDGRASATSVTTFVVRPSPDAPKLADIPPQTAVVGEPLVLRANASDADGDPLAFRVFASSLASGAMNATTGVLAFVPTAEMVGTHRLTITVTDPSSLTDSTTVWLTVLPEDHAPVLVDLGAFEVRRGESAAFTLAATDLDGDPITFATESSRVTLTPSGRLALSQQQVETLPDGVTVIPVTVSDGLKATEGSIAIVVRPPESATPAAYGSDLAPLLTTATAVACAAAGVALTMARSRRAK